MPNETKTEQLKRKKRKLLAFSTTQSGDTVQQSEEEQDSASPSDPPQQSDQQPDQLPNWMGTDGAPRHSRRRYFVRRLDNLFESTWVDAWQPIDNDSPLPRGWKCRSRRNLWWSFFNKHAMTITYENPRQRNSPAEQLRRGSTSSDPIVTSIATDGAQGTRYERPPAYQLRSNHQHQQSTSHFYLTA
jgi:hypothetical protein